VAQAHAVGWLRRTALRRSFKMGFEVIGGLVAEGSVSTLVVEIGEMVADFRARFA